MEWEYDRHIEYEGKTYHLWSAPHREGFTAYAVTHQPPAGAKIDFVKPPKECGFFTSLEAVMKRFKM